MIWLGLTVGGKTKQLMDKILTLEFRFNEKRNMKKDLK